MLIAENNPKFFREKFGSDLPPIFAEIEAMFAENGGKIGASFNSGFQENALSIFGEAADFFTADNVPETFIPKLLEEGNINMTKDDLMTFYNRVFLDSDVMSEIDAISAQTAGEFVSEFDKNLEGFSTIIDAIQGNISKVAADRNLANATKRLNDLLKEQTDVTNSLAGAQAEVDRLRERDKQRTAAEKLRIRDITRRRDFLKKAVEEGQDATLELAVAEEELAEATKEADEPTRELIQAEQELLDIQTRIKDLPDEIAEARSREEEAILRVVSAQQQLNDINDTLPDLTAGQISFFSSIAISAGVAESKIDSLLSKYSLFDTVVSTPPVITPPVVKTDGGGVINTDIPMFSKGGFLPVGGQGIVGERGAELITATSSGVKISPLESVGFGETNITVNVTGFPTDPIVARNIADNIRKELVKLEEEGRGGLLSR